MTDEIKSDGQKRTKKMYGDSVIVRSRPVSCRCVVTVHSHYCRLRHNDVSPCCYRFDYAHLQYNFLYLYLPLLCFLNVR